MNKMHAPGRERHNRRAALSFIIKLKLRILNFAVNKAESRVCALIF